MVRAAATPVQGSRRNQVLSSSRSALKIAAHHAAPTMIAPATATEYPADVVASDGQRTPCGGRPRPVRMGTVADTIAPLSGGQRQRAGWDQKIKTPAGNIAARPANHH